MNAFAFERTPRREHPHLLATRVPRLVRAFWFALPLTLLVGAWMVLTHVLAGTQQSSEPVRADRVPARVPRGLGGALGIRVLCRAALAGPRLKATVTSVFLAVATAAVFGAGQSVRDGLIALTIALPVTAVLVWFERRRARTPRRRSAFARGAAVTAGIAGLGLAALGHRRARRQRRRSRRPRRLSHDDAA